MNTLNIATLFSGIGAPEQGAIRVYDDVKMIFRQIEKAKVGRPHVDRLF